MIACVPAGLLAALAGLLCALLLWQRADPPAPYVAPPCQYGGGGMYNPVWYGPCPTATRGPVIFQAVLGAPNPTETPWPTH